MANPVNQDGKAFPGSKFKPPPAVVWNNMVDAGRAFADGQLNSGQPQPTRPRSTDIIKARNDSGAARRRGEILRIEGKAITTIDDESIWLLGVAPTDDGYFGILKHPTEASEIESLQVSGCCMALVNVTSETHTRAASSDGDYVLQSGDSGPIEILYAPAGTGELECAVRFAGTGTGGSHRIWFRIESADDVFCDPSGDVTLTYALATPIRYTGGCNVNSIPGIDSYGQVEIHQICNILNEFLTVADLEGAIGSATWMANLEDTTYGCEYQWLADKICGEPECG